MSEQATTIPPKGLGKLHISDFWKSLILSAIVNVLLAVYPIIQGGHWPTHADLDNMLKSTVAIIIGYLIKNLGTNNVGQLLKPDEPVVKVNAEKLDELTDQSEVKKK